MTKRTFTPAEELGLSARQKEYLIAHPTMVSLQAGSMLLPREQLYQCTLHGAVTIDRAMELDEIHASYQSFGNEIKPVIDNYTDAEDRFIDQEGMSSDLY